MADDAFHKTCESCVHWDNSCEHGSAEPATTGICRVLPPTADERDHRAVWPFTEYGDWCGRYALNKKWRLE
jgi:hypothetical protein